MNSKHLLYIIPTLVALILYSCAGESMKNDMVTEATESAKVDDTISDEIFRGIEEPNTELTPEQIKAFQIRAIQKFEDFTGYIKIISDPDVESDLAEHSMRLALELFVNDTVKIKDSILIKLDIKPDYKPFLINKYLLSLHFRKYKKLVLIKTKSIKFISSLAKDSTNLYQGTMEASLRINGKKSFKNIDVHLVEIRKEFGDNSQAIMEVRLGNIY